MDNAKLLNENKVVSSKYTHILNYKEIDKKLLVDADTASWSFIHKDFFKLIDLMDGKHTIGDILNSFSNKEATNEVLEMLWDSGVLALDDKTVVGKNLFQSECAFELAVLNVTLNCNLRCAYCYADAGCSSSYMPPEIMEKIVREFVTSSRAEKISVLFHGGEPLLKFENIKEGCKRIKKIKTDKKIEFLIQTNGTLITDEIATFFKEEDFHAGVSIDGPSKCNDRTRVYPDGKGSFKDIMKGISALCKKDLDFGALCVLNKNNINDMENIFNFFITEGMFYTATEPFFLGGRGGRLHNELSITSEELFQAMKILYHKIDEYNTNKIDDNNKFKERNLTYLINNIIYDERTFMCKQNPCGATLRTLGFNPNGDVYPCDDFAGISKFKLGNITKSSLNEILKDNPIVERFRNRTVNNIKECNNCPWKYICCGERSCTTYFSSGRIEDKSFYCDYYKKMIDYFMKLIGEDKLKLENFLFCSYKIRS